LLLPEVSLLSMRFMFSELFKGGIISSFFSWKGSLDSASAALFSGPFNINLCVSQNYSEIYSMVPKVHERQRIGSKNLYFTTRLVEAITLLQEFSEVCWRACMTKISLV